MSILNLSKHNQPEIYQFNVYYPFMFANYISNFYECQQTSSVSNKQWPPCTPCHCWWYIF